MMIYCNAVKKITHKSLKRLPIIKDDDLIIPIFYLTSGSHGLYEHY